MTKKITGAFCVLFVVFACGAFMNDYIEQKRVEKFHAVNETLLQTVHNEGERIRKMKLKPREYATIKSLSS